MSKTIMPSRRLVRYFPASIFILVFLLWLLYYLTGFPFFNKNNVVSIFSSVIQGMSALLSVAIAVIVFRIQSLENRNQSLEQSTLNYIFQITKLTYPEWIPSVEEDIRSKGLANRYYNGRIAYLNFVTGLSGTERNKRVQEYAKDRDVQQKDLMKL